MAAAMMAVEVLRTHGERTKTRLADLVDHYCRFYGEDEKHEMVYALDLARRTVLGFDDEA